MALVFDSTQKFGIPKKKLQHLHTYVLSQVLGHWLAVQKSPAEYSRRCVSKVPMSLRLLNFSYHIEISSALLVSEMHSKIDECSV